MQEPPFPAGGKLCPAAKKHPRSDEILSFHGNSQKLHQHQQQQQQKHQKDEKCNIRISHDRWALNVKVAEARWAQKQARERELEEVMDFLQ